MKDVKRKPANKKYRKTGAIITVIVAPIMAPTIVNISRYIAIRMLVTFSFTKDTAEPLEVAIIATMPHATASFTGTPKRTRTGISMLAPPKPVREPKKPTRIESKSNETMSINVASNLQK